ncbi:MAG: glucose-1-phosphate cytidylyltransferase [Candidatus Omnitrophica bacterium]|nr:glucose-1-phosphate cytidylyltransferase [Candidatus Omnitrophota bacterium]
MTVMILCGGIGSRLAEETEFRPKPMLEIGGRPILWHIMKGYAAHGFRAFVLCLGYKGHIIKDYFLNYRAYQGDCTIHLEDSARIEYHGSIDARGWSITLVDTGQAAQTGARVRRGGRYVQGDAFCLTYGDGLSDIDLNALLAFHRSHGKMGTVTGVRPPGRFGELEVDGGGRATQFNEKPQVTEGIINGGFFVFQRSFLETFLDDRDDLVLEQEPLQRLARAGELMVYPHRGFWQPMDTYRELKLLNELWAIGQAPWRIWS